MRNDAMLRTDTATGHATGTTVMAVSLAFALAWLTYRFVERPVRAHRPVMKTGRLVATLAASLALVAVLGFATMRSDGFLIRYPSEVQALLTPLKIGEDYPQVPVLYVSSADQSNETGGPFLVVWGDSHAGHLLPGLHRLQSERIFKLNSVFGWGLCSPLFDPKPGEEEKCRAETAEFIKMFDRTRPDIVVLAALWGQYPHVERIDQYLLALQRIGIRRVVVVGPVPVWRGTLQSVMYQAYKTDPMHRVPERIFDPEEATRELDGRLREITSGLGVDYISAYDALCSAGNCLVRVGNTHKDIIQVDGSHLSAVGSWFLISRIADRIFGSVELPNKRSSD
jgi:hypothetical protein